MQRYVAAGNAFVDELNGLFCGVLVDRQQRRGLLFNDRYGSERMYIAEFGETFVFATQAKAILGVLPHTRAFADESVAEFIAYGSVLHDRTLFRGIGLLPAGSQWTLGEGRVLARKRYFTPATLERQPILAPDVYEAAFIEEFHSIIPAYLNADSRVGIALTGGLDTRMIMASVDAARTSPVCYTFVGTRGTTLDARIGARVANTCGLEHHVLRLNPEFLRNFSTHVDRTVWVTDGTAGVLSAHEIHFNALASQLAPVRLTGNYGGEILRTISTLKHFPIEPTLIASEYRDLIQRNIALKANGDAHPVTRAAFQEIPWHLAGILTAGRSQLPFRSPFLDNRLVDLAYQAPQPCRLSSFAFKVVAATRPDLAGIATDRGETNGTGPTAITRRLAGSALFKLDYLYAEGLPSWLAPLDAAPRALASSGLVGLHKYLQYRLWFRRDLSGYLRDGLAAARERGFVFWNGRALANISADHIAGRRNFLREIHLILTLEAVDRLLLHPDTAGDSVASLF